MQKVVFAVLFYRWLSVFLWVGSKMCGSRGMHLNRRRVSLHAHTVTLEIWFLLVTQVNILISQAG